MLHHIENLTATPTASNRSVSVANVSRRAFLGTTATGFALAAFVSPAQGFVKWNHGGLAMANGVNENPLVFVSIDEDGTVTLVAHRAEMGTGARTSLPMIMADEMEADWSRVKLKQAEGDEIKYGNQDTDGSRSLRHHIQSMRIIGASMRHMLASAAAAEWNLPASEITVENHVISHASGKSAGFGEMAKRAMSAALPAFEDLNFKDESQFRYIGKGQVQIADLHDITTGKAVYGADVNLPGMLYAAVKRPPVVGQDALNYNAAPAGKIPGVITTVPIKGAIMPAKFAPLGGLAVVASNTWAAIQGAQAVEIEWSDSPHASYNSESYLAEMVQTAQKPGAVLRDQGDFDAAKSAAAKTISRTYTQAHMQHAPMEPPVAVADVKGDRAEIWAPVQSPYGARQDIAAALGIPVENVTVNVTLLGGGFGRKSKCDFAIEAALVSREMGAPVKLQWTREDDIRHGFNHTTSAEHIEATVDSAGKVTGWRHNSTAPSILSTFAPDSGQQFPIEHGMGLVDVPFDIPNIRAENGKAMAHTRIGWFRAVSNIPRAWAIQSFAAELADELGRDQKEMLLELIGAPRVLDAKANAMPESWWNYGEPAAEFPVETGRLSNVLDMAAKAAGWGKSLPEGEGIGLACHRSFVSYVACAARVKVVNGEVRVPELHLAIDAGYIANPERVESQLQGAAVMGMTAALHSGVTYTDGAADQSNFHDYEMVRSTNYPENVVVHMVDHPFDVHSTGVGEPGVPPVPPAIANAVANATGQRHRHMPFGQDV